MYSALAPPRPVPSTAPRCCPGWPSGTCRSSTAATAGQRCNEQACQMQAHGSAHRCSAPVRHGVQVAHDHLVRWLAGHACVVEHICRRHVSAVACCPAPRRVRTSKLHEPARDAGEHLQVQAVDQHAAERLRQLRHRSERDALALPRLLPCRPARATTSTPPPASTAQQGRTPRRPSPPAGASARLRARRTADSGSGRPARARRRPASPACAAASALP